MDIGGAVERRDWKICWDWKICKVYFCSRNSRRVPEKGDTIIIFISEKKRINV